MPTDLKEEKVAEEAKEPETIRVSKEEYEKLKSDLAEAQEQLSLVIGYYQRAVALCNAISDKFIKG